MMVSEEELVARGLAQAVDLLYKAELPEAARIVLSELAVRKRALSPSIPVDTKAKVVGHER